MPYLQYGFTKRSNITVVKAADDSQVPNTNNVYIFTKIGSVQPIRYVHTRARIKWTSLLGILFISEHIIRR